MRPDRRQFLFGAAAVAAVAALPGKTALERCGQGVHQINVPNDSAAVGDPYGFTCACRGHWVAKEGAVAVVPRDAVGTNASIVRNARKARERWDASPASETQERVDEAFFRRWMNDA
jgi:hypothetical protein